MYKVYLLSEPNSDNIKYIGLTQMPLRERLRKHVDSSRGAIKPSKKERWIKSLLLNGLEPKIELIEEIKSFDVSVEDCWIAQMRAWGFDLTNITTNERAERCKQTMKGRVV